MPRLRQGGFLISKIHQLSGRIFAGRLRSEHIELSPAQGRILFALWQSDDIAVQELARRTALSKSTLTRMIDRLEATGHVVRATTDDDRRRVFIRLTARNKTMRAEYEKVSAEMAELFYRGFSTAEIDECERYLTRILTNLSDAQDVRAGQDEHTAAHRTTSNGRAAP